MNEEQNDTETRYLRISMRRYMAPTSSELKIGDSVSILRSGRLGRPLVGATGRVTEIDGSDMIWVTTDAGKWFFERSQLFLLVEYV